ncbi:MAG TPA: glycosyltransferase [Woeseiaceae bacterium]|nr:glycosyltransferase [Woeseiaceae bacterium]
MKIAIVGLTYSSSWGNGHATTWRSLVKGLVARGHRVAFYEREQPWYAAHRDVPECELLTFYRDANELLSAHGSALEAANVVIVGSYVREAGRIVRDLRRRCGLLAFYDIDTPVTLAALAEDRCEYLDRDALPLFDLYLSFSGGSALDALRELGARRPVPLYCSVDPDTHAPVAVPNGVDLGYLGTWSRDRQEGVRRLLLEPATRWTDGRFVIAGAQYPDADGWPSNVRHVGHLAPGEHAGFYCAQRFTLNVTRAHMRRMGHSPSVRLFEAACCGTPIISDDWPGLAELFRAGEEILVADETGDVLGWLTGMPDDERQAIGQAARERVLSSHTGARRAAELEAYLDAAGT